MRSPRAEDAGLARFCAHLIMATAAQLAVLVATLALHAIGTGQLRPCSSATSAWRPHGAVTLAPRLRRHP